MSFSANSLLVLASIRTTLDQPVFPGKILVWILFMLSILSWVMILSKLSQFTKAKKKDREFTERLRKSRTTLEVFEEGWEDENSLKNVIYQSGAREAAFQLLGSREPQERMQSRIKEAGKLGGRQLEFLKMAFQTGCRAATARLHAGIEGLRLVASAALLLGTFGLVWTLMIGFDEAKEFSELAPMVGGALGYLAIGLLVATPAFLARIAFHATARKRKQDLERFRDDIHRLFERSFAEAQGFVRLRDGKEARVSPPSKSPGASETPQDENIDVRFSKDEEETNPPSDGEFDGKTGKKRYHSIRERLLRREPEDETYHFEVNPIARQTASLRSF